MGNNLAKATHIVLQHQEQPSYAEAVRLGKQVVTCYWVHACVQLAQLQTYNIPVRHCMDIG